MSQEETLNTTVKRKMKCTAQRGNQRNNTVNSQSKITKAETVMRAFYQERKGGQAKPRKHRKYNYNFSKLYQDRIAVVFK